MRKIVSLSQFLILLIFAVSIQAQVVPPSSSSTVYTPQKHIPPGAFFNNPERTEFRISPDSKRFAYLAPFKDYMNLHIAAVNGGEPIRLTSHTERGVGQFRWVNDNAILYLFDTDGNGRNTLFLVNTDNLEVLQVTDPGADVKLLSLNPVSIGISYFMQMPENANGFDLWSVNIADGMSNQVKAGNGKVSEWYMSNDGARIIAASVENGMRAILSVDRASGNLTKVSSFPMSTVFEPVGFDPKSKTSILVKSNNNRDKVSLISFDLENGKEREVTIAQTKADLGEVLMNWQMNNVIGIREVTSREYKAIDIAFDPVLKAIGEKMPAGNSYEIYDCDERNNLFMICSKGVREPKSYWMYNHANKELRNIAKLVSGANAEYLCDETSFLFKNRAGQEVRASRMISGFAGKTAPTIILLPEWTYSKVEKNDYNAEVQCLANKGFLVIRFDYSGSPAYAKLIRSKGYSEWGQLLQQDLVDLAQDLIKSGASHPDKIVLMGKSFGAFIASAAIVEHPDVFRAGVFVNGITDMNAFLSNRPLVDPKIDLQYMISGGEKDIALLQKHSITGVSRRIENPLFFAYCSMDEVVPQSQSVDAMVTLAKLGTVTDNSYIDDFHEMVRPENKTRLYEDVFSFLNRNTGSSKGSREETERSKEEEMRKARERR